MGARPENLIGRSSGKKWTDFEKGWLYRSWNYGKAHGAESPESRGGSDGQRSEPGGLAEVTAAGAEQGTYREIGAACDVVITILPSADWLGMTPCRGGLRRKIPIYPINAITSVRDRRLPGRRRQSPARYGSPTAFRHSGEAAGIRRPGRFPRRVPAAAAPAFFGGYLRKILLPQCLRIRNFLRFVHLPETGAPEGRILFVRADVHQCAVEVEQKHGIGIFS